MVRPVERQHFARGSNGPMPMIRGATPAAAVPSTRALGLRPKRCNRSSEASNTAQAPSFTPDAFPAVMVPFALTIGFNAASASRVVSGRGCSSLSTVYGGTLARVIGDRRDLLRKAPLCIAAAGALLAAISKRVLVLRARLPNSSATFSRSRPSSPRRIAPSSAD